uniref:FT-interacting protein 1-like n=1 Tax=Tanacetum cinerariifolium TaxID=118510 RepID=A0A6L2JMT0_TANCI|nr:FT-interacting protein 1-like [Tanacetum cinerariifolium]
MYCVRKFKPHRRSRDEPQTAPMMTIMIVVSTELFKKERWNATPILNEPFKEPLILSVEDTVRPNKDDVLGRCMLPLQYVERRLDHKAINTRRFNLEKHVMVVEGEKKKEVKFVNKIHMKYINPVNGP